MRGLLMLSVLLGAALPRVDGQAGPQLATMIELSSPENGPSVATLYFNDQNVMLESSDTQVFVLNSEAMLVFNPKEKSYAIQTYEELRAAAMYKANELAHSKDDPKEAGDIDFKLSGDGGEVAGVQTRKLVKLNHGKTESEIFVAESLLPARIRAEGERLRAILPPDYWKKIHASPGMIETVLLFGIPLKMTTKGHTTWEAHLAPKPAQVSFEVPPGYKRIQS